MVTDCGEGRALRGLAWRRALTHAGRPRWREPSAARRARGPCQRWPRRSPPFLILFHPVFDKQKFPKITAANQLEKQRGEEGGSGVCPVSTELVWSGTPQRAAPSSLPLMKSPEAVIVKLPW